MTFVPTLFDYELSLNYLTDQQKFDYIEVFG